MAKVRIKPRQVIRKYAESLNRRIKIDRIIQFGSSVSSGKISPDSDLDIVVLSDDFKKMGFLRRLEFLSHARRGIARRVPMDILGYTEAEFKSMSKSLSFFKEIVEQGKVVYGQ